MDINLKALNELRRTLPDINSIWSPGRELPFRDRWFDLVFTMGVAYSPTRKHSAPRDGRNCTLFSSLRSLWGYFAEQTIEVPYRNQSGALSSGTMGVFTKSSFQSCI